MSWPVRIALSMFMSLLSLQPVSALAADLNDITASAVVTEKGEQPDWSSLQGKWLLINFWATWCPPCVQELPALDHLYTALHKDIPFAVVAINLGDQPEQLSAFWQKMAWHPDMPVMSDPDNSLLSALSLGGLPSSWLVNPQGQVVENITGIRPWDAPETVNKIKGLVEGTATP